MPVETTYTALREKLAGFLDRVTDDNEVVIVRRRGRRDVAILPADELSSLLETAHLLSSRKNAQRLLRSLDRANRGEGTPETIESLRRSVGLDRVE
jgi:antitoxin YefM